MGRGKQLELNRQKQSNDVFKTAQTQESMQIERMFERNVAAPIQDTAAPIQEQTNKTVTQKKRFGIFSKKPKEYDYTEEKTLEFRNRLLDQANKDLAKPDTSQEFQQVVKAVSLYANMKLKKNDELAGTRMMELQEQIRQFLANPVTSSDTAQQKKNLQEKKV